MITIIHNTPSIAGNYLAELRDVTVQQNKVLFRRNIQRLGVFMAYELSKHLSFEIKNRKRYIIRNGPSTIRISKNRI
jgi:uracil phosphoribosyltransferase